MLPTGQAEAGGLGFRVADMGASPNSASLFGVPHNKEYSISGSILGSPYLGKPSYHSVVCHALRFFDPALEKVELLKVGLLVGIWMREVAGFA